MPIEPHDLHHDFPEFNDQIHQLKETDNHFRNLFDQYHTVDKELHVIEHEGVNTSDARFEALKKQRAQLKDEIYSMLKKAAA